MTIKSLDLDGALVLDGTAAPIVVEKLTLRNAGVDLVPLDDAAAAVAPEVLRIRGYTLVSRETREIVAAEGQPLVVDE